MAALDGLEQRRAVMVLATLRLVERWGDHPPWRLLTRTADGRPGGLVVRSLPGSLVLPDASAGDALSPTWPSAGG